MDGWIKLSGNDGRSAKYVNRRSIVSVNDMDEGIVAVMRNGDTVGMPELPPDEPKLPYDAEVEYLESTGTQWIDTGVVFSDSTHTYQWDILAQSVESSINQYHWFCGFFENDVVAAGAYSDNASYKFYPVGTYYQNDVKLGSPLYDGDKHGVVRNLASSKNKSYVTSVGVFRRNRSYNDGMFSPGTRVFYFKIYDDNTLVRDFIPVRVGTEGCLYDRRGVGGMNPDGSPRNDGLYRNQGTGAFVVGPDTNPISARSYVNDGLIAMWDGIENAGWGTHDPNATVWKDLVGGISLTNEGATVLPDGFDVSTGVLAKGGTAPFPVGESNGSNKSLEIVTSSLKGLEVTVISPADDASMGFAKRAYHNSFYPYCFASSRNSYCDPNNSGLAYRHFSIAYTTFNTGTAVIDGRSSYSLSSGSRRGYSGAKLCVGSVYGATPGNFTVHVIRLYSRALSADEIAHNYAIDKERFNLQ